MNLSFLLADDIHVNRRNFSPLFTYLDARNAPTLVHTRHSEMKQRHGDYDLELAIEPYRAELRLKSEQELFDASYPFRGAPIRLFSMSRSESLSYVLATRTHWHDEPVPVNDRSIFARLHERDLDVLINNLAAAAFWIDEWSRFLGLEYATLPSHAFVFSGSLTYARVLLQICQLTRTRAFVLESTFTGREFYLEERYRPIANRSEIRFRAVRDAAKVSLDPVQKLDERGRACERVQATENKNVKQPPHADLPAFAEPYRPMLLIVGQVVNDFSLIEQTRGHLSSVAFYEELMRRVLTETDYNVVFKGHPWEQKKVHVKRPFTRERLEALRGSLSPEHRDRFAIRDEDNLLELARAADRVALLSSQAGIELAFHVGLKASTFGSPFYGGAGFTDDYERIEDFIRDVRAGRTRAVLSLGEYDSLIDFLVRYLVRHAISDRTPLTSARDISRRIEGRTAKPLNLSRDSKGERDSSSIFTRKLRKLERDPIAFVKDSWITRRLLSYRNGTGRTEGEPK